MATRHEVLEFLFEELSLANPLHNFDQNPGRLRRALARASSRKFGDKSFADHERVMLVLMTNQSKLIMSVIDPSSPIYIDESWDRHSRILALPAGRKVIDRDTALNMGYGASSHQISKSGLMPKTQEPKIWSESEFASFFPGAVHVQDVAAQESSSGGPAI